MTSYTEIQAPEKGSDFPELSLTKKGAEYDVAIMVVNRDRVDLVDSMCRQLKELTVNLKTDTYIIEMGSKKYPKVRSDCEVLYYPDPDFRGKCFGHNVGLHYAAKVRPYKYYWFLMNDLVFRNKDSLCKMIQTMENHPNIGILSPTEFNGAYVDCASHKGKDIHLVSTCDYLSLFIRREALEQVGFLNPVFKYCWGAIHELAYKMYSNKWKVAYCDKVVMKHLGGTTYGKTKNTISREQYIKNAKRFAANYFRKNYGNNWEVKFTKVLPKSVKHNTFVLHKRYWCK